MRRRLVNRDFSVVNDRGERITVNVEILGPSDLTDDKVDEGSVAIHWDEDPNDGIRLDLRQLLVLVEEADGVKVSLASMEDVDPRTLMRRRKP